MNSGMRRWSITAALAALAVGVATAAASAQVRERPPQARPQQAQPASPARLGFGADNDAQPGGVPGNAPFNNQLRKFSDPLGANGGK